MKVTSKLPRNRQGQDDKRSVLKLDHLLDAPNFAAEKLGANLGNPVSVSVCEVCHFNQHDPCFK